MSASPVTLMPVGASSPIWRPGTVHSALEHILVVADTEGIAPPSTPFVVVDKRTMLPLTIQLQGVLRDFALDDEGDGGMHPSGLGGWEAIAFVRLVPGYPAWVDLFEAQKRAVASIVRNIFQQLDLEAPANTNALPQALVLRRRLLPGDGCPEVSVLNEDGGLSAARDGDLDIGDLVHVSAWFDIVVTKGEDGLPRTAVFLAFDHVVRSRRQQEIEMKDRLGLFEPCVVYPGFGYVYEENIGWPVFDYLLDGAASDEEAINLARKGNRIGWNDVAQSSEE